MPNVKLYVDERVLAGLAERTEPVLLEIRTLLCQMFGAPEAACHLVIIGVRSMAGQLPVNIELAVLRKPDRPREAVDASCARLQAVAADLFGVPVAIRCTLMDPEIYVVKR